MEHAKKKNPVDGTSFSSWHMSSVQTFIDDPCPGSQIRCLTPNPCLQQFGLKTKNWTWSIYVYGCTLHVPESVFWPCKRLDVLQLHSLHNVIICQNTNIVDLKDRMLFFNKLDLGIRLHSSFNSKKALE
jgi:hypothetical protein